MKKQKEFTLIEILVGLLVIATVAAAFSISPIVQVANATQAAQSSVCLITADVLEVTKERQLIRGSEFQPPSPDYYIDYYHVHLTISEISLYKKAPGWIGGCDNSYAQKVQQNGAIMGLAEYQKNPISPGQRIKAYLNFSGDERFHGFFLSGVQVLGKVNLPTPTLTPSIPIPTVSPLPTISPSNQPKPSPLTNLVQLILNFISNLLTKLQHYGK